MTACSSDIHDWGSPWADSFKTFKTRLLKKDVIRNQSKPDRTPLIPQIPHSQFGWTQKTRQVPGACRSGTQYTPFECQIGVKPF
jgi:hypothetical protein